MRILFGTYNIYIMMQNHSFYCNVFSNVNTLRFDSEHSCHIISAGACRTMAIRLDRSQTIELLNQLDVSQSFMRRMQSMGQDHLPDQFQAVSFDIPKESEKAKNVREGVESRLGHVRLVKTVVEHLER